MNVFFLISLLFLILYVDATTVRIATMCSSFHDRSGQEAMAPMPVMSLAGPPKAGETWSRLRFRVYGTI